MKTLVNQEFVFEGGLRVNNDAYTHVMNTVVRPWVEGIVGDTNYMFSRMVPLPTMPTS